jgi:FkbM family methyltransferase
VSPDLRTWAGLARSAVVYYARPWKLRQLTEFYRQFLSPGDLAFDIGAHLGNRSIAMTRAGARVVALEPQEAFFRAFNRFRPASVTLLPFAAGPEETTAKLAISSLHPTVSSLATGFSETVGKSEGFEHVRWDRTQDVQVTTLDRLIAKHGLPKLLKIDVEGFEADVLAGLSQPIEIVAFEYLPATLDTAFACIDRLTALGTCEFNLVKGERQRLLFDNWLNADTMRETLRNEARDGRSGDVYARSLART